LHNTRIRDRPVQDDRRRYADDDAQRDHSRSRNPTRWRRPARNRRHDRNRRRTPFHGRNGNIFHRDPSFADMLKAAARVLLQAAAEQQADGLRRRSRQCIPIRFAPQD
jgi:hypothetical protein